MNHWWLVPLVILAAAVLLLTVRPAGYNEVGIASWYGPGFHGKTTANGELYDMYAFTAAHKTLPFGTPEDVRREVQERIETFAPEGGFVFNPIHNIQPTTPVENMLAMFETVRDVGGTVYAA